MKSLSSFMCMEQDGGTRVAFTYTDIDNETGDMISMNNKGSFFVVDKELMDCISYIRKYITETRLGE